MTERIAKIESHLGNLRGLIRSSVALRGASLLVLALVGTAAVSLVVDRLFRLSPAARAIALVVYAVFLLRVLWKYLLRPVSESLTNDTLADMVEKQFPQALDSVRSAVDFARDPRIAIPASAWTSGGERVDPDERVHVLMKRQVVQDAVENLEALPLPAAVDTARVATTLCAGVAALAIVSVFSVLAASTFRMWWQRNVLLSATVQWPYRTILQVEGFSKETPRRGVPRGDPLRLRVRAFKEIPDRVRIRIRYARDSARANLARQGDSAFVYEHAEVTEPFEFAVEGGDYRSEWFEVFVKERPEVRAFRVALEFPAYTNLKPQTLTEDIGELAVPEGTRIGLEAVASKPLKRAWLEAEGRKIPLTVSPDDPHRFSGRHEPAAGGMVTVHLEDTEAVPPNHWLRFLVSPVKDRLPTVRARSTGVGSMITPQALMPLDIQVRDDYLVTGLGVEYEIHVEGKPPVSGKQPFVLDAPARQTQAEPVWDIQPIKAPPDARLDIRVFATDNDALHGSKTGYAATQSFLIVTPERLLEEFLRREEEQRRILERAIERQSAMRDTVYRLVDQAWNNADVLPEPVVEEMIRMAKSERQLDHQMRSISQAMQRILVEMRHNRIAEVTETERLAGAIIEPLKSLADRLLPAAWARLARIREMAKAPDRVREGLELAGELETILDVMNRVLESMKRIEGFTEVVNRLRSILKIHTESAAETAKLYRREIEKILEDIPFEEGSGKDEDGEEKAGPESSRTDGS